MSDVKSTMVWHIENLYEQEPDCQVVQLVDALKLEYQRNEALFDLSQLEYALEKLVDLCNNTTFMVCADEVIHAEATLERIYQKRKKGEQ